VAASQRLAGCRVPVATCRPSALGPRLVGSQILLLRTGPTGRTGGRIRLWAFGRCRIRSVVYLDYLYFRHFRPFTPFRSIFICIVLNELFYNQLISGISFRTAFITRHITSHVIIIVYFVTIKHWTRIIT